MAYKALYRRFRPTFFRDVAGQEIIIKTLRTQVENGRIAHAYLFTGPRGTGKTSVAKIFARSINCPTPVDGDACGSCDVCRALAGESMDIIEMDAASNNGVDEVRDLREKVVFPPQSGRYKVYIIDEVHMLSTGAFNALLKTLEEPPAHAVFILATTEVQKLPATILSRCQRYNFQNLSVDCICSYLDKVLKESGADFDPDAIRLVAVNAEGGMRDALSMADMCISYCGDRVTAADVVRILGTADTAFLSGCVDMLINRDSAGLINAVAELTSSGSDIGVFMRDLTVRLSDCLAASVAPDSIRMDSFTAGDKASMAAQGKRAGVDTLIRAIEILSAAESELKLHSRPRVLLEAALVRICTPFTESDNTALCARIDFLENQLQQLMACGVAPAAPTATESAAPTGSKPATVEKRADPSPNPDDSAKNGSDELFQALKDRVRKSSMMLYSSLKLARGARLDGNSFTLVFGQDNETQCRLAQSKAELIASELSAILGKKPAIQCITEASVRNDDYEKAAKDFFGEDNINFV